MKKINTRFGEVEYDPNNLLHFPAGLIGLPNLRHFIVMPNKKQGPLFWIQSVDDPDIAFVLTDPTNFFLDYQLMPEEAERQSLDLDQGDECFILSVVTVPSDQNITLNLAAPILFAPKTNKAIQVIVENSSYSSKTPLPQ
ncbi:flagellar assembly protein FliW [Desulfopila sp. IMCC35006]|uniref:flagellar assembly protein FliW n=1 Tax=Desulfopila sp. IMCC35006 TaxID=2569542 RepID=UPI0010ABBC55|nr:flagellar assembly protein FliW [Desulfopila sp. IMCC35006]TKB25826.1 flagellar assembly protein FliW [Desulfopila sp. IMCC35006]